MGFAEKEKGGFVGEGTVPDHVSQLSAMDNGDKGGRGGEAY